MRLPVLTSCCGCASLTTGAYVLGGIAICEAAICIAVASSSLPNHKQRAPEDNLLAMMTIMNASLFLISNVVLLVGVGKRRAGCVNTAMLSNALLLLFGLLLLMSECLFSVQYKDFCFALSYALLVSLLSMATFLFVSYYFLVVNSLHLQLKQSISTPTPVPV